MEIGDFVLSTISEEGKEHEITLGKYDTADTLMQEFADEFALVDDEDGDILEDCYLFTDAAFYLVYGEIEIVLDYKELCEIDSFIDQAKNAPEDVVLYFLDYWDGSLDAVADDLKNMNYTYHGSDNELIEAELVRLKIEVKHWPLIDDNAVISQALQEYTELDHGYIQH